MNIATTLEQLVVDFLKALVANVGLEEAVRLVMAVASKDDQARVRAILAAEYAANDAAVDVLEQQKLKADTP
jgi:hypothetical protein